jgi:biopolymer transport protein ExbD
MKKKHKRLWVKPAVPPNSDINVTPLVDIVLVMLIIFMVVTPLLEKDITVRVPATEQVEAVTEVPPDQLVVQVNAEGEFAINTNKVTPEEYVEKLRAILEKRNASGKTVFVVADDKANYARLVAALDGARQAGAETLGMMTELPEGSPGAAPPP